MDIESEWLRRVLNTYIEHGHTVMIERHADTGAGFSNKEYEEIGAVMMTDKNRLFDEAEMIVKVKESTSSECELLNEGQILLT